MEVHFLFFRREVTLQVHVFVISRFTLSQKGFQAAEACPGSWGWGQAAGAESQVRLVFGDSHGAWEAPGSPPSSQCVAGELSVLFDCSAFWEDVMTEKGASETLWQPSHMR